MPSSSTAPASFIRVEPKVFFANERTLLSWLNFTVMLAGLSLGLLNFGTDKVGKISGVLFTVIAMGIMLYALYLYLWRANMIRRREGGPYDSRFAPVLIVIVLFAAMCINFGLRVSADSTPAAPGSP
ncbi:GTPase regulator Nrf1 [Blastocladiella emersonii ATCC 22665]|uniref:Vacuolar transport chaperone 1 n=1 Tax=Blastocladiella emersonii TaxID=4808 RepID=A0A238HK38_BLAEM|nr:GTPase regulator Nrf1 [Blastocladiella emersonii ATCC 22665]SMQ44849.1 Vacuolar transport chaperone 1 [Blastocladiella emersonii]